MFEEILKKAVDVGASDIHLKAGAPPIIRKHGKLISLLPDSPRITTDEIDQIIDSVMDAEQKEIFQIKQQIDLSFGLSGIGRFRLNIFKQRGSARIVVRTIATKVPPISSLGLPPIVEHLALSERGLILVTGATGSGKSTTLASMINYINSHSRKHISHHRRSHRISH